MKQKHPSVYVFLLLLLPFYTQAQLDRQFWFAVPEVANEHADRPIKLHLSSGARPGNVSISIPARPDIMPQTLYLNAGSSMTTDITDWINILENDINNVPQAKGLYIESDEPITAYYEVLGSSDGSVYNTDIFILKGGNALGNSFYTPFQTSYDNVQNNSVNNAWSSIDVVATEDNTTVTFELTQDANNQPVRTFSVTLNRGQTYSVRAGSRNAGLRLTGSKITSDKPIAVTVKDDSIKRTDDSSYDLVGDQLIPVSRIGLEYVLSGGENFIVATEDNTNIFTNGALQVTLDEGESVKYSPPATAFLEASKPVYVFQIIDIEGEYGGALLPHTSCTGSYEVNFSRATSEGFSIDILVKNGGQNNFRLNGNTGIINGADFIPVNGTGGEWRYYTRSFTGTEIPVGQISTITNANVPFHLGIINGSGGTGCRYGYFSNFNILDLGVDFDACDNSILQVAPGLDQILWSTGDTTNSIQVDSSGIFWVEGTEGVCMNRDTINVEIKEGIRFSFDLSDTAICDEPLTLDATSEEAVSYLWSTGDTSAAISVTESGLYKVTVTNQFDCSATDFVSVEKLNAVPIDIRDSVICDETLRLAVADSDFDYAWMKEGDTLGVNNIIELQEEGEYVLISRNQCSVIRDTFYLDKRNFDIPNVFTPNNDEINDDIVLPLGNGDWFFSLYNRWGRPVYRQENFDGILPELEISDGTYYYLLHDSECDTDYNGWIQILK